ncbi:MAG: hypothetical protein ACJ77Y_06235 [Chloroflexota bacterium]
MTRRLAGLAVALVATLSLVLAACGSPPAAPALTDPKEILAKAVTSLSGVKTLDFTGTFSGKVAAAQLGTFDLSGVSMSGAADLGGRKAKLLIDAPNLLGTRLEAILVDDAAYLKVAGAPAMLGAFSADRYTKLPMSTGTAAPLAQATDPAKLVAGLQAALALLPVQPAKAADDRCGDADCYHLTLAMTGAQLQQVSGTATGDGDVTLDLFTRKQDYRPARLQVSIVSPELGTIGMVIEVRYDVGVSISAPAANQIAP